MSDEVLQNGFDIPKIKMLRFWVMLIYSIAFICGLAGAYGGILPLKYVALTLNIIALVLWIVLWNKMHKSTGSLIVHGILLFILGFAKNGLLGFLLMLVATSQAQTIVKHNGNVDVTFWNVKPRQQQ